MITRAELEALRAKYVEMKRLRDGDTAGTIRDPRPAMRALAARFPGALREIDQLPIEVIEERIASIDRALADPSAIATWMIGLARYHALLRTALSIRRHASARTVAAAREWLRANEPASEIDDLLLAALVRPPAGRLSRVVLAHIARELGTSAAEIERALTRERI